MRHFCQKYPIPSGRGCERKEWRVPGNHCALERVNSTRVVVVVVVVVAQPDCLPTLVRVPQA